MTRRLALCADDFGAAQGIDAAIGELAVLGRLSAVSCLVNAPHWMAGAPLLQPIAARVDIGLHFNLTEGAPVSAELAREWPRLPTLHALIARAHLGLLPRVAIEAELAAQLGSFARAMGAAPAFVDGHQHVHHLPGVRELVLAAVERLRPVPAVRNTGHLVGPGFGSKRALIERTGGRALQGLLRQRGIAHNAALTGVYDFAATDYGALMRGWLMLVPKDGALLFCHPGDHDAGGTVRAATAAVPADPIAAARVREFAYLRSESFVTDVAAAGVELGPVWRVVRAV